MALQNLVLGLLVFLALTTIYVSAAPAAEGSEPTTESGDLKTAEWGWGGWGGWGGPWGGWGGPWGGFHGPWGFWG